MKDLLTKYPAIVPENFFFECDEGWYNLLDNLLSVINHRVQSQYCEFYLLQVKEKFGGLRFYYHGGDDYIAGAADLTERLSYITCDQCGAPGDPVGRGGYYRTRCKVHE